MDLAFFSLQKFELFLLVLVRTAGIFTLTPIFGSSQAPAHVRLAAALALTMVFVPIVPPASELPVEVLPLALMVVREACVGLVIGFVCNMVFAAIEIAGHFVDAQSGFSFATMLDPVHGSNMAVAGRFQNLMAGLLFFVTDAHHLLIRGMADSFSLAPVGQMAVNPAMANGMLVLFSGLFGIAVRIAAPIVAAVFLADVAFAIIARIVPQINVLIIGFPLKLGVGLAAMVVAVPLLVAMSQGMFGDMYREIGGMIRLLTVH